MQLLLSVGVTLLVIVPALCWPANDNVFETDIDMKPTIQSDIFLQEIMSQDQLGRDLQEGYNTLPDYANSQDNNKGPALPKETMEELQKQLEAANGGDLVDVQATSTGRALRQGCTIALQLTSNDHWFGCPGTRCCGYTCPGLFFEGSDWTNCFGEVFQMYRAKGLGYICNGDLVGLYYRRGRNWVSTRQGYGSKSTCPGYPTTAYGFSSSSKWKNCGYEMFQVYVKGKPVGAAITDQDNIAFYYPCGATYLRFLPGGVYSSRCLLQSSRGSRPPTNAAFDGCKGDSVEITIRD